MAEKRIPVEILERRVAHKGKILTMYDDTVKVNGNVTHWDFIHHDGAAAVLPVTDGGKIIMVRQYRHALGRFTLEIPAGKLDSPDEPKIDCARRELEEETGYLARSMKPLINVNTTVAFCDEFIGIFLATDLVKTKQRLDADEEISVEEWELSELIKKIFNLEITDSKTVAAVMAYAALKRNEEQKKK